MIMQAGSGISFGNVSKFKSFSTHIGQNYIKELEFDKSFIKASNYLYIQEGNRTFRRILIPVSEKFSIPPQERIRRFLEKSSIGDLNKINKEVVENPENAEKILNIKA